MSEIKQIEIFTVEEKTPENERSVIAWDRSIKQWREAIYLKGQWIDAEGLDFWPGQISKWFDLPFPTGFTAAGTACYPPVLDACCGGKSFWFDKDDGRALFMDIRRGEYAINRKGRSPVVVQPDVVADFASMPIPDESFRLVVFDPPHFESFSESGTMAKTYGVLRDGWRDMLRAGFAECFRVLEPGGFLVFKWCEWEIPVRDVLALTEEKPLFGHKSGKAARTHWVTFMKSPGIANAMAQQWGQLFLS